jgi:HSP20 family protein
MVITTPKSPSQQSAAAPTNGPAGQDNNNNSNAPNVGTDNSTFPLSFPRGPQMLTTRNIDAEYPRFGPFGFGGFGTRRFPGFPPGPETVPLEGHQDTPPFPPFPPFFRNFMGPPPGEHGHHTHPDPPLADMPPPPHGHGHGPHGGPPHSPFWDRMLDPSFAPNLANIVGHHARAFAGDMAREFGSGPTTRAGPCGPSPPPLGDHHHRRGPMRGGFGWRGGRGGWGGPHHAWPGRHHHPGGGPWHDWPIYPRMDIYRTETTYTVTIELPGLKKKDVDISVKDGNLTISGEFVTAPDSDEPSQPPEMDVDNEFEFMGYTTEEVALDDGATLRDDDGDDGEKKKGCFVVRERRYGKFKRTIRLPSWVNVDEIKATMEHGVLKIVFEKPQPESSARKVSIL